MKQTISNWYKNCSFVEKAYARKIMATGFDVAKPSKLSRFKAIVICLQLKELLKNNGDNKSYVNSRKRLITDIPKSELFGMGLKFNGYTKKLAWPFLF